MEKNKTFAEVCEKKEKFCGKGKFNMEFLKELLACLVISDQQNCHYWLKREQFQTKWFFTSKNSFVETLIKVVTPKAMKVYEFECRGTSKHFATS